MRNFRRSLGAFAVTVVVGGIAIGACLAALIPGTVEVVTAHRYTADEVRNLRALSQPSTVYYDDGTTPIPCGKLGIENREPVTLSQVPKRVIDAVIATEDRTFWTNPGIDLGAVFRAFVSNVTSGKIEQGGSTITQQLVKKRILSDKRDVNRKIKEIEDALRLNRKFSKQKILQEYRGRPVVINFFASWCNPCRAEFPILRKELTAHHGDYVMLGIDYRDISSDAQDFVKSQHAGWPMLSDPDNAANTAYGIRAVPQTIFVDRSGVIAERIPQQLTAAAFGGALAKILTGAPPPTRS
jgi:thiol-disulfide isomerase/thioredoxin